MRRPSDWLAFGLVFLLLTLVTAAAESWRKPARPEVPMPMDLEAR
jgi:hypothetical protein